MFLASIMSAMRVCVSLSSQANVARASSPLAFIACEHRRMWFHTW